MNQAPLQIEMVSIDQVELPKHELRRIIPREGLEELAASIKRLGVINALNVVKKKNRYIIVAGVRRYLAAKIAGLATVPVVVIQADRLDQERIKVHENISREDINPVDQADHLRFLKDELKLPHAEIADIYNRSVSWVSQILAIHDYDPGYIEAIRARLIKWKVAQILMKIPKKEDRDHCLRFAVKGGISQEKAQIWLQQYSGQPYVPPVTPPANPIPAPDMSGPEVTGTCFWGGEKYRLDGMYIVRLCPECYQNLRKAVDMERGKGEN